MKTWSATDKDRVVSYTQEVSKLFFLLNSGESIKGFSKVFFIYSKLLQTHLKQTTGFSKQIFMSENIDF